MVATRLSSCEVSPFGHPRFKACKAAPRGFSQPTTSFFGVLRQGILCARLSNFLRFDYLHSRVSAIDWLLVDHQLAVCHLLYLTYAISVAYVLIFKLRTHSNPT
jgi:hypothetical protein